MIEITKHFYTLQETADLLGLNRLTIRRWIDSGKLEAQRAGGVVFIDKHYVDDLLGSKSRVA